MNTIKFMVSKKLLLALSLLMVIPLVKAQDTLRLDLNQALEIALSENPTIRVADKEIKLKKEARKEAFAGLFPEVFHGLCLFYTVKRVFSLKEL